jgi:predicted permease
MNRIFADVARGLRLFRTSPGFAAAVVAAIALGVGTNTAVFSVVNAVILKPVPFPEPDRVVQLQITREEVVFGFNTSPAKFMHWRELDDVFSDVTGFMAGVPLNLTQGDVPELISAARVTEGYFRVFGAPMARGRAFAPAEDVPNAAPTVVVSHAFWTNRLASDPDVIGTTVSLSGTPHTVIGVAGEGFDMRELGDPEVWVPFQLDPASTEQAHFFRAVARLAPGVTLEQAQARMAAAAAAFRERFPTGAISDGEGWAAVSLQDALVGDTGRTLWVLLGAVAFVLLIACANVASLLLVRATRRRREIAIRSALGAGRRRIVLELLTESVLLSTVGGVLGVALGLAAMRGLLSIDTAGLPRLGEGGTLLGIDWRIAAFAVAVSLGTGVLFGLVPALASARVDLNAVIKSTGSRSGGDRREGRMRSVLVLGEVVLAVVLLIGAALLIRTSLALASVEPGFSADNVLVLRTSLTGPRYATTASVDQAVRTGRERLRAISGVIDVGTSCCVPTQFGSNLPFDIVGREPTQGQSTGTSDFAVATPGYFGTFRIPVLRGRDFSDTDTAGAPGAVIVNQAFADRYWPNGADALGERIVVASRRIQVLEDEPEREIVGIVANVRNRGLDDAPMPTMYVPHAQLPDAFNAFFLSSVPVAWAVRTAGDPSSLTNVLERELRDVTGVPVTNIETMEEVLAISRARERFNMLLMSIFAGAALVLAALGIYGLLAYSVQQRTQELGIRLALGAEPRQIRSIVLRQGAVLLGVGVAVGLGAAFYLARLLESFLFGVEARDALVFTSVPVALLLLGLATVAVVAARAGRTDPLEALRYE